MNDAAMVLLLPCILNAATVNNYRCCCCCELHGYDFVVNTSAAVNLRCCCHCHDLHSCDFVVNVSVTAATCECHCHCCSTLCMLPHGHNFIVNATSCTLCMLLPLLYVLDAVATTAAHMPCHEFVMNSSASGCCCHHHSALCMLLQGHNSIVNAAMTCIAVISS
jgi:hypothetical protein